jgi:hypothetical protein
MVTGVKSKVLVGSGTKLVIEGTDSAGVVVGSGTRFVTNGWKVKIGTKVVACAGRDTSTAISKSATISIVSFLDIFNSITCFLF